MMICHNLALEEEMYQVYVYLLCVLKLYSINYIIVH